MHKENTVAGCLRPYHLLFSVVLVGILVLFSTVIQDRLLFKTDLFTLSRFFVYLSWLVFGVFLVPLVIVHRLADSQVWSDLSDILVRIVLFLLSYGFIVNLIDNKYVWRADVAWRLLIVNLVAFAAGIVIARLSTTDPTVADRLGVGSALVTTMGLVALVIFLVVPLFTAGRSGSATDNVVLIVVDSLPTYEIAEYCPGPAGSQQSLADLDENFLLFDGIYTNHTHTYGFFDTLFSGFLAGCVSGNENLISVLQDAGVRTRWIASHLNATPDSHAAKNYTGFRSSVVNHRLSWLLRFMGLDYNLCRTAEARDGLVVHWLARTINKILPRHTSFAEDILAEVRQLRSSDGPFFLMVHAFPSFEKSFEKELWNDLDSEEEGGIETAIRTADYRYGVEAEMMVSEWREDRRKGIALGFETLAEVLHRFVEEGWFEDTVVILTADHGYILDRGKAYYGYHKDEEVARVPFVVFNGETTGRDSRLGETIDVTATVLDLFGVERGLNPSARSLLASPPKDEAHTLTSFAPNRDEQFLSLYRREFGVVVKYSLDLRNMDTWVRTRVEQGKELDNEQFRFERGGPVENAFAATIARYTGPNHHVQPQDSKSP